MHFANHYMGFQWKNSRRKLQIANNYSMFMISLVRAVIKHVNYNGSVINVMANVGHYGATVKLCGVGPCLAEFILHDDVIKWKYFTRYWPFVRGIHRSLVNSPHKGQWRGALMLSLIYAWINGWGNNGEAGDLRRHRAQYTVTVMN